MTITDHTICQTVHRMNIKSRKSLRVNKRCAKPEECTQDMIGCKAVSATEVVSYTCKVTLLPCLNRAKII